MLIFCVPSSTVLGIDQVHINSTVTLFMFMFTIKHMVLNMIYLLFVYFFRHTASLATYVRRVLLGLRHDNGMGVCVMYGIRAAEVGFLFSWDIWLNSLTLCRNYALLYQFIEIMS